MLQFKITEVKGLFVLLEMPAWTTSYIHFTILIQIMFKKLFITRWVLSTYRPQIDRFKYTLKKKIPNSHTSCHYFVWLKKQKYDSHVQSYRYSLPANPFSGIYWKLQINPTFQQFQLLTKSSTKHVWYTSFILILYWALALPKKTKNQQKQQTKPKSGSKKTLKNNKCS